MRESEAQPSPMKITYRHAELCGGLADFHRILILYAVAEKAHNVTELVTRLELSQPAISRHLKILRDCGAVTTRREGKAVYYSLADNRILQALDLLRAVSTDQMKQQGSVADSATNRPTI